MKLKTKTPVTMLMVILIAFAFITCVNQDIKILRTDAVLKSLKIKIDENITDMASRVAAPISSSVMDKEDLKPEDLFGIDPDKDGTDIGWVDIRVRNKDTDKIQGRIITELSGGAHSVWGIGTRTTPPAVYYDTRVPANLDDSEYIYIRVVSEDGKTVNYYRFCAKLLSWTTNLQYIRIDRKLPDGSPDTVNPAREGKAGADIHGHSTGGSTWDHASECTLSIAQKEGVNAIVTSVTFDPNATVEYAVLDNDTTEPTTFTPPDQAITINDQNFLYVRVIAENTVDKEYFKFKVSVGRIANIATFILDDGTTTTHEDGSVTKGIQVYGLGLPQSVWSEVGFGEYQTAKQPTAGYGIILVPDDPDATIGYAKITNDAAAKPTFAAPSTTKIKFTNSSDNKPEVLAVEVKSANGLVTLYYKVRIMNLAATITKHPKAAWYYQDDIKSQGVSAEGKKAVVPLTIELDPPDTGQYEYEWYEADSWYGLYGRHGTPLDEKNNITTVNGGPGQYFYLVQPDEIPYNEGGATGGGKVGAGPFLKPSDYWADLDKIYQAAGSDSATNSWAEAGSQDDKYMAWTYTGPGQGTSSITPRTDWKNHFSNMVFWHNVKGQNEAYPLRPEPPYVDFLSGATNESRYYWVKVTDKNTKLTVTSDRALILTETDKDMVHFIFDLSILPKKNLIPFTKEGTAYDNIYKIDLKDYPWPADIEENLPKFQICIAHAQYFLPDGRPWTQNWTHGNLHFGMDDKSMIWYHNNMGANGGSIPLQAPHSAQGGMTDKPEWIGFTPSGDPAKGLPPPVSTGNLPKGIYSMDAKDPYPAGVAQGYFAGFIELLEIRFSLPPKD